MMDSVMTMAEVSAFLRVHPSTIRRLLKQGRFPGFRVGSDWRFRIEAVEQWVAKQGNVVVA